MPDHCTLVGGPEADVILAETWFQNVNPRHISIESDAKVNGGPFGKIGIDPWVRGAHPGFRF